VSATVEGEDMPFTEHRLEFHESLDAIRQDVVRLGALTTEAIGRGTAALLDKDLGAAQSLIDDDDFLDALSLQIEDDCYRLLALQNPIAGDLRFIICSIRLVNELERSADLMVNVCKAARRLYDVDFDPRLRGLIQSMADEATRLTKAAIDAYVDADAALGAALDDMDSRLDDLQVKFVETMLTSHQDEQTELRSAVQLALIGRYYERIGDHAVNMGERVCFMVSGWLPEHTGAARLELRQRNQAGDEG
jgi:phosphate transport system protein